ncbi:Sulfite exporter TauE/SafE [Marinomonas spartinae]|uniref:TSUP family transporter n=1 Tax=Marinomonas spartinae TaxID=1792290 RepID=UPI000808E099|nr:TSUP family transporter [Marinomonas spartinae]SBS37927.1 Sulfite exporter TauE/SafE [Marinomonas spartinae]
MDIQFIIFLLICGAFSGALFATVKIGSALFIVPTALLFMPVFQLPPSALIVPVIATAITSMVPILLVDWLHYMKTQQIDTHSLIAFAPGAAMGGVIGAQVVSLMTFGTFGLLFGLLVVMAVINVLLLYRPFAESSKWRCFAQLSQSAFRLPITLLIGCVSVMSASSGKLFYTVMLQMHTIKKEQVSGVSTGLALFVVVAAMVGFSFPAKAFALSGTHYFIGAVHLPTCMVLAISQLATYLLCRNKGNNLDKGVVHISAVIFLVIAVLRIWIN